MVNSKVECALLALVLCTIHTTISEHRNKEKSFSLSTSARGPSSALFMTIREIGITNSRLCNTGTFDHSYTLSCDPSRSVRHQPWLPATVGFKKKKAPSFRHPRQLCMDRGWRQGEKHLLAATSWTRSRLLRDSLS